MSMTTGEKIEVNANLVLWCTHILGPDDVIAAPSHIAAEIHARELNKSLYSRTTVPADEVLCFAYAAPWPHSKESHAKAVLNWIEAVS
jgi:hypothetical protein